MYYICRRDQNGYTMKTGCYWRWVVQLVRAMPRKQTVVGFSPTRGSFFLWKITALGELCCVALSFCCVVLPCLSFWASHGWLKSCTYMYNAAYMKIHVHIQCNRSTWGRRERKTRKYSYYTDLHCAALHMYMYVVLYMCMHVKIVFSWEVVIPCYLSSPKLHDD